jgi:DNA-binding winged helix-turn-helix (wHTH) protein
MVLEHVWDINTDPFTNTVEVHIRFLRRKLGEGFKRKLIKTVHGYGYISSGRNTKPRPAWGVLMLAGFPPFCGETK